MTALDLSADVGLLAVVLATANICLGLLIAVRYSPRRLWPHRRINIFAVHTWTAYLLLTSISVHMLVLFFEKSHHWRLRDIVFPLWSPVQPVENSIGAAGFYLVSLVLVTSFFRLRLGRRWWKAFHYLVYAAAVCVFLHGILTDPQLKGDAIDPFDGEKLLVEACLLIVIVTTVWAARYRIHKNRVESALGVGRYHLLGDRPAD